GNKLDITSKAHQTEAHNQKPGHKSSNGEAFYPVLLHNGIHNYNKRAGGPANLHTAATQRRNGYACNNGCNKALFRRNARRNGKSNGQRQSNNTYHYTRNNIVPEMLF